MEMVREARCCQKVFEGEKCIIYLKYDPSINIAKKKDQLPDFYNIILEKHKDDPDGYDIMIVDPINRGNFVSRFSHSCDPNCGSVPTVAKGNYCIAMYCMKPISFGEELTFDYFSV